MKYLFCGTTSSKESIYRYATYKSAYSVLFKALMNKFGKADITDITVKIDNHWSRISFNKN